MSEEPLALDADERRLAAILAVDVAGYSRLMACEARKPVTGHSSGQKLRLFSAGPRMRSPPRPTSVAKDGEQVMEVRSNEMRGRTSRIFDVPQARFPEVVKKYTNRGEWRPGADRSFPPRRTL